eukprot:m.625056 g.625056  ORF g.625056 m.625056 type:complete len:109 (-) comp22546_c0_seq29:1246-1572(-)
MRVQRCTGYAMLQDVASDLDGPVEPNVSGGCGTDVNGMDFTDLEGGYTTAPIDQYSNAATLLKATMQEQGQEVPAASGLVDRGGELVQAAYGEVTSLLDSSMAYLQNM